MGLRVKQPEHPLHSYVVFRLHKCMYVCMYVYIYIFIYLSQGIPNFGGADRCAPRLHPQRRETVNAWGGRRQGLWC